MSLPLNTCVNSSGATMDFVARNHAHNLLDPHSHLNLLHKSSLFGESNDTGETSGAPTTTVGSLDPLMQPISSKRPSLLAGTTDANLVDSQVISLQPYSTSDLLTSLSAAAQVSLALSSPMQAQLSTAGIASGLSPELNSLDLQHYLQPNVQSKDVDIAAIHSGHSEATAGSVGDVESDFGSISSSSVGEMGLPLLMCGPTRKKRRQVVDQRASAIVPSSMVTTTTTGASIAVPTVATDSTATDKTQPIPGASSGDGSSTSLLNGAGSNSGNRVLTAEEKRERNRQAQRAFRERRERYVQQLEFMVRELQSRRDNDINALQLENASLRQMLSETVREIARLRPEPAINAAVLAHTTSHTQLPYSHPTNTIYAPHSHTPTPLQQHHQRQPQQHYCPGYSTALSQPLNQAYQPISVSSPMATDKTNITTAGSSSLLTSKNVVLPVTTHGSAHYTSTQPSSNLTENSSDSLVTTTVSADPTYNNEEHHTAPSADGSLPFLQSGLDPSFANWFLKGWNTRQDAK